MDLRNKLRRRWLDPLRRWQAQREPGVSWAAAARAVGLTEVRVNSSFFWTRSIQGRSGPLFVSMEAWTGRDGTGAWMVTVTGLPPALWVREEGVGARIQKRLGIADDDVETGDPTFDGDFLVTGDTGIVRALFDASTRQALRRRFDCITGLFGGKLSIKVSSLYTVGDALKVALDLARRLVGPEDIAPPIARNALEDPAGGVRLLCLRTLIRHHPRHPVTRETLRRACGDAGEGIRLEAALELQDDDGYAALRRLALEAGDETCASRAVRALQARLDPMDALNLLIASLDRARPTVAASCIDVLGGREPDSIPAGFETVLIERALGHSDPLPAAAAAALARMGTVAAVLPLQEGAQRASGSVRRTMEDAVRAIQARLSGAERGQLTVSGAEGGTVTLASDGGEVSLPDPDRSRVE